MSKQANLYKFLIEMGRRTLEQVPSPYKEEITEYYKEQESLIPVAPEGGEPI